MSFRVAVVGGGLAGLAAVRTLLNRAVPSRGSEVTLYEARPEPGGRFTSWKSPEFSHPVDNGQHVLTGSCTSSLKLFEQLSDDPLEKIKGPAFLKSSSELLTPRSLPLVPPPLKYFNYLNSLSDSLSTTIKAGRKLLDLYSEEEPAVAGLDEWLSQNQPAELVQSFWKPLVRSVYNREVGQVNFESFRRWFRKAVIKKSGALKFYFFNRPLSEVVGLLVENIRDRGADVRTGHRVKKVRPGQGKLKLASGQTREFDRIITCVPPDNLEALLDERTDLKILDGSENCQTSPILSVNMILSKVPSLLRKSPLVLLETGQFDWLIRPGYGDDCYVQLLTSAARELVELTDAQILTRARTLLEKLPAAGLEVETARVFRNRRATYFRPGARQLEASAFDPPESRLTVAGDWTVSSWPSTLEAAVRSGERAARAIL